MDITVDRAESHADPVDELIPPPRRWWASLLAALAALALVSGGSVAYGFGWVYPQPDCCGSGGGGAPISLTTDGEAVMVAAYFHNSSGRALRVNGARAELPGATVLAVGGLNQAFPLEIPYEATPFPITVGGGESALIAITFRPDRCAGDQGPWGAVTIDLAVADANWPTIGRSYELPDPVVDPAVGGMSVWGSSREADATTPLAAACALLDRDRS